MSAVVLQQQCLPPGFKKGSLPMVDKKIFFTKSRGLSLSQRHLSNYMKAKAVLRIIEKPLTVACWKFTVITLIAWQDTNFIMGRHNTQTCPYIYYSIRNLSYYTHQLYVLSLYNQLDYHFNSIIITDDFAKPCAPIKKLVTFSWISHISLRCYCHFHIGFQFPPMHFIIQLSLTNAYKMYT